MKKLTKKSLIILGLFTSLVSYADDTHEMFREKEPMVTNVSFNSVKQGSTLSIKDTKGLVLYKESILQSGAYSKGFDLTSLPNGDYYFELDKDMEIEVIPFNVVSNQVKFKREEKSIIFKPFIRVKDDMVYVSRIAYSESPIEYKIYYLGNNDLVLSEKSNDEKYFKKVYDFSTAEKGTYLFIIKSEGRKYTKTIKI